MESKSRTCAKRIMVIGRNYGSNLSMVRSLGMAGYDVDVIHIIHSMKSRSAVVRLLLPEIEKYSKYCTSFNVCITDKKPENIIKSLLELKKDEKELIVPTDDLSAGIIDEYYDELSGSYILPDIGRKGGKIAGMMSKARQKELAAKFGIKTAKSYKVTFSGDGDINIPDDMSFPCFIKPDESRKSSKTVMRKCSSKEELIGALEGLALKKEGKVLIEEFIDLKCEYSFLGISMDGEVIAPGFFRMENDGGISNGVAVKGRIIDTDAYSDIKKKLCSFVKELDYNGLFDIDLIESADGTIYFAEINLRFGGSGFAITRAGVNLPGMLADYIFKGSPIDKNACMNGCGRTFVNESVVMDLYMNGKISKDKALELMDSADIKFVYDKDDMKPYEKLKGFFTKGNIMRKIKHA